MRRSRKRVYGLGYKRFKVFERLLFADGVCVNEHVELGIVFARKYGWQRRSVMRRKFLAEFIAVQKLHRIGERCDKVPLLLVHAHAGVGKLA